MTTVLRAAALAMAVAGPLAVWTGHAPAMPSGPGVRAMPDLSGLTLRTDPAVKAEGRIIKGLYYAAEPGGQNVLVAFFNACAHRLEAKPFLIYDFGAGRYYYDGDRDGRVDETGAIGDSVDPVPFAQRADDWASYCYGDGDRRAS